MESGSFKQQSGVLLPLPPPPLTGRTGSPPTSTPTTSTRLSPSHSSPESPDPAYKVDVVSWFHNAVNALKLTSEAMFLWLGRDVPLKAASTKLLSSLINGYGSTLSASDVLPAVRVAANARHNDHLLSPEPMSIDIAKASTSLKQPQPQVVVEDPAEPETGLPELAFERHPHHHPWSRIINVEFLHDDVEITDAPPAMDVAQHPDGGLSTEYEGLNPEAAQFLFHVIELSKLDIPLQFRGSDI
ncbi:hypothetical protein BDP55DRAFT_760267 [Colletotrichum godetiae]|uniref:Uncharacterized protein n=1 Tax=Colletotrichum godetiae TaxID=1209918 RepID=A0AAJ0A7M5_9PEZI|nr:uncharacterized protein BDP55DRAFT_760267 [Colletotrichum godetiae]KAK1658026.1 hypothetical protein BDP55DRAFT_760267 [Colletotrichum godetiae]